MPCSHARSRALIRTVRIFPVRWLMHQSFETPASPPRAWAGHSLFMQVKASELPGSRGKSEWWAPPPQKSDHHETPTRILLSPSAMQQGTKNMMIAVEWTVDFTEATCIITTLVTPRWTRKKTTIWRFWNHHEIDRNSTSQQNTTVLSPSDQSWWCTLLSNKSTGKIRKFHHIEIE